MFILRFFSGVMAWLTIIAVNVGLIGCTVYAYANAGGCPWCQQQGWQHGGHHLLPKVIIDHFLLFVRCLLTYVPAPIIHALVLAGVALVPLTCPLTFTPLSVPALPTPSSLLPHAPGLLS
jgi:hypothetical protein